MYYYINFCPPVPDDFIGIKRMRQVLCYLEIFKFVSCLRLVDFFFPLLGVEKGLHDPS